MGMYQAGDANPSLRASDADREQVVEVLRRHTAEGRITAEEFDERMTAAYAAKTMGALAELTTDLPVDLAEHSRKQAELARAGRRGGLPRRFRQEVSGLASLSIVLTTIWLISGGGYFWPVWPIGISVAITAARAIQVWGER